jgi:hypothetical protein
MPSPKRPLDGHAFSLKAYQDEMDELMARGDVAIPHTRKLYGCISARRDVRAACPLCFPRVTHDYSIVEPA